jgi:hypothetical protein
MVWRRLGSLRVVVVRGTCLLSARLLRHSKLSVRCCASMSSTTIRALIHPHHVSSYPIPFRLFPDASLTTIPLALVSAPSSTISSSLLGAAIPRSRCAIRVWLSPPFTASTNRSRTRGARCSTSRHRSPHVLIPPLYSHPVSPQSISADPISSITSHLSSASLLVSARLRRSSMTPKRWPSRSTRLTTRPSTARAQG